MVEAALKILGSLTGCSDAFRIPVLIVRHAEVGFSGDENSGCCHPHVFVLKRDPSTDKAIPIFSNTRADKIILDYVAREIETQHSLISPVREDRLHKVFRPEYPSGLRSGEHADLCSIGRNCCLSVGRGEAKTRAEFETFFAQKRLKIERINNEGITARVPNGAIIEINGGIMGAGQNWTKCARNSTHCSPDERFVKNKIEITKRPKNSSKLDDKMGAILRLELQRKRPARKQISCGLGDWG